MRDMHSQPLVPRQGGREGKRDTIFSSYQGETKREKGPDIPLPLEAAGGKNRSTLFSEKMKEGK